MKTITGVASVVFVLALVSLFDTIRAQQKNGIEYKNSCIDDFEEVVYPQIAATAHVEGAVVIRVKLDRNGKPTDVNGFTGRRC
jgi:hypothetical protein